MMTVVKADGYGHGLVESAAGRAGRRRRLARRRGARGGAGAAGGRRHRPGAELADRARRGLRAPAVEADVDLTAYTRGARSTRSPRPRGRWACAPGCSSRWTPASAAAGPPARTGPRWSRPPPTPSRPGAVGSPGSGRTSPAATSPTTRPTTRRRRRSSPPCRSSTRSASSRRCGTCPTPPAPCCGPGRRFDLVRCGIASYGLSPAPDVVDRRRARPGAGDDRARPARPGQAGAGRRRACPTATPGPPSGTPRSASCRSGTATGCRGTRRRGRRCSSRGARRPVAGRVCMDQLVVDLGDDRAARRRRGGAVRRPARTARRPRRTGPRRAAPSPTRSSPGSAAGSSGGTSLGKGLVGVMQQATLAEARGRPGPVPTAGAR